jgi:Ti-type conjugative transfer relaxase TraA
MAIIEVGGGISGAGMADYLETGIKIGRTQTRDELDRRVVLSGDLREVAAQIDDMHTKEPTTERYIELVISFQEHNLTDETLKAINKEIQDFILGGYAPGETSYYSEAHMPKVLQEVDKFGEIKDRHPHIHAFIPKVNNFTGRRENPLGMLEMKYGNELTGNQLMAALQEHINYKFGLTSPKDPENRRTDFTSQAEILAKHDGHDFAGRNRDWQQIIRDRMVAEGIETKEDFERMVRTIGTVTYGLKGTDKQYLKVKPFSGGDGKNVRLDDWQFSAEFITMPTAAKLVKINEIRVARYIETQPPRPTPEQAIIDMAKFKQHQDTIRFLHNGSQAYKDYQAADQAGKLAILAEKRAEHYANIAAGLVTKAKPEQAAALENEQKTEYQLSYEAMLLAEFPNRRLNATHYRTADQIQSALAEGEQIIADPETALDELTFSQSTITQKDLERYLLKHTADDVQYKEAMAAVLAVDGLVIRKDEKGRTTFTTADIASIEKSLVDRVDRLASKTDKRAEIDAHLASPEYKAEAAARKARAKANPISLNLLAKLARYILNKPQLPIESLHGAGSIHSSPMLHESPADRIAREVAATKSMNKGQREAFNMLVSDRKIGVVNGSPGTGKSYILAALREVEELKGNTVLGAVLQGKTGEDLMRDSGINTSTLHSLLFKLNKGIVKLDSKTIVVIDETGMVGSRQLENLLMHIEKSGARLRMVGDTFQLHSIEFGAAFKAISERCDVVSLTEIMRQKIEWQRDASMQLAEHKIAAPLQAYSDHGNINFAENAAEQQALVIKRWNKLRTDKPKESSIVLVATNHERNRLNTLMRQEIKKDGGLQNEVDVKTASGIKQMAVGERIMFVAGNKDLNVKNGTSGVIDAIDQKGNIFITTDTGLKVTIRADGKGTKSGNEIDYAYASTIHKSQGMTVDHAIALPSPGMALENSLVAFTRHKHSLEIVCNKQQFEDLASLTAQLDKTGRKDFSHDATQAEWQSTRTADTLIQQYKADFSHDKIIQRTAEQTQFKEMNSSIDARLLIDRLAASNGIAQAIYGITKKEGQDLIQCGSRALSISDFLTKELHMDFKAEVMPVMRAVYANQLENVYAPMREQDSQTRRKEVDKPVWQDFQKYKDELAEEYKARSKDLAAEFAAAREAIRKDEYKQREASKKNYLSPSERKKVLAEIKAAAAESRKVIAEAFKERKGELMKSHKPPQSEQYKEFLAERAPDDVRYMRELIRVSFTPADQERLASIEASRAIVQAQTKESIEKGLQEANQRIHKIVEQKAAEQTALAEARRNEASRVALQKSELEKAAALEKEKADKLELTKDVEQQVEEHKEPKLPKQKRVHGGKSLFD